MQPRKVSGTTITPKSSGTVRGSNTVPKNRPSDDAARHASGTNVISTGQL